MDLTWKGLLGLGALTYLLFLGSHWLVAITPLAPDVDGQFLLAERYSIGLPFGVVAFAAGLWLGGLVTGRRG